MIRIYNDDYNKEYDKLIYDTVKAVAKHFETLSTLIKSWLTPE